MKLSPHGPEGHKTPALLHSDGTRRDLRAVPAEIDASKLLPAGLSALAAFDAGIVPQGRPGVPFMMLEPGDRITPGNRPQTVHAWDPPLIDG